MEKLETTGGWAVAVLVALIGPFMAILDTSIVNVAVPTIMRVFNTDTTTVEWVLTIYMLALGVVVPLSGWAGDRLGLKNLYVLSLTLFTLGSVLCTFSWSIGSLIAARVVQAIGGGMIMPTTMAMVYRMVPRERFGSAMGVFGIALLVAPAIGPTLGGYLVEYVNWRWIFTINLPVGLGGILLSRLVLPEFSRGEAPELDIGGAITAGAGLLCLLLALSKGTDWGWRSEAIVLLLYASAVFLGLFVYLELTHPNPLLDLRVFRYRTFTLGNILVAITTIALFSGVFYVPLFLQQVRGLGAMETGLLMMPAAVISGLLMPVTGRLYDRVGPRLLCLVGLAIMAASTYLFHNLDVATPTSTIQGWLILRSIGMSLAMMPVQTAAVAVVPPEMVARASAMTNIINRVAGSFGIAVFTSILTHRQAVHGAYLAAEITATKPTVDYFLRQASASLGEAGTVGPQAAALNLAYLQGMVARASFVLALEDIFVLMAAMALTGLLPAFFLEKGQSPARPGLGLE